MSLYDSVDEKSLSFRLCPEKWRKKELGPWRVKKRKFTNYINPSTPRRTQVSPSTEISILFWEGIVKKVSYERRAYELVDEKEPI